MTAQAKPRTYLPSRTEARPGDLVLIEYHAPMTVSGVGPRRVVEYDLHRVGVTRHSPDTDENIILTTIDRWSGTGAAQFHPHRAVHGRTIERWTVIPAEDVHIGPLWSEAVEHALPGHPAQPAPWFERSEVQALIFRYLA